MRTIAHLTLFTGHLRNSPRHEVDREAIDKLMPYVMSAGGEIENTGWTVRMIEGAAPGSHCFELHHSGLWLLSCYMAWTRAASTPMWEVVKRISKTTVPKPKTTPWLAVHAMPATPMIMFKALHAMMEAGDLERCIAWTVIEAMAGGEPLAA
ncbi:hypothetical protein JJB09_25525 [Rhizobium sp. KVB221]|uniref:Uncharacterized protein n=1 Tax=Rhizobium setariae TaxID=2801340 RepID=A0A936YWA3_9HYPH|nr:hypothetical protein [Rhizobium setariae]MBL0375376.1 hypothetical protein [Rhizobium setariae]